jgi:multidrug efflux pump subunit AcrA (membrane-fusion protein)
MTVAFSESDITSVKVGRPATVSIAALSGVELGAKLTSIAPVGTASSGVVSYSATLTLTQSNPQVRPGMSATATVITSQQQGVTVPNQAITGSGSTGTVELLKNGKATPTEVVVGLRGTSRSVILSGLSAGAQLQVTISLPALGSSSTTSSSSGTLGGTGFGGLGGLGGGGGGGFGRFGRAGGG